MDIKDDKELLLGRNVPVAAAYSPQLLFPIPRAQGRAGLPAVSFCGADLWHLYELSWLDASGKPQVRVGRLTVPADSPNMVESKSLKLYLNALNNERIGSQADFADLVCRDVGEVVGAPVELELLAADDPALAGSALPGTCLDDLPVEFVDPAPDPELLVLGDGDHGSHACFSHLLRSLCPVTGQPDWASVWVRYEGDAIEPGSLLRYLVAFRNHQEFHEQCVERIFADIHQRLAPERLEVQAFYTRRGGLDINPYRSTEPGGRPLPRLDRQ